MADVSEADRGAQFRCVLALTRLAKRYAPNYSREFAAGESANRKQAAAGSDTIRYLSRTASPKVSPNLVPPPKNTLSHRAKALANWPRFLTHTDFTDN